jgi:Uncharacterized conserved protein
MTLQERSELVLDFAQVLHVNGQSTDETVAAAERLGNTLNLRAGILPHWGELQLEAEDGDARLVSVRAAAPTGVDMHRVASAMRVVDDLEAGRVAPAAARAAIGEIFRTPPAPTWLFALAAAAGADAVAVLFGVRHLAAIALIAVSAAGWGGVASRHWPIQYERPAAAALRGTARRYHWRAGGAG